MFRGRFVLGILCLFGAVYLYAEINAMFSFPQPVLNAISSQFTIPGVSDTTGKSYHFSKSEIQKDIQACNTFGGNLGAFGDFRGLCIIMQTYYYSPWILGIIGVAALFKAGPYYYRRPKYYR